MSIGILPSLLLSLGALVFFIGTLGLLRFPEVYTRLHAVTKGDSLGIGLILLGLMLHEGATLSSAKIALILAFSAITSPTAAHALARGAYKHGVRMYEASVVDRYKEASAGRQASPPLPREEEG